MKRLKAPYGLGTRATCEECHRRVKCKNGLCYQDTFFLWQSITGAFLYYWFKKQTAGRVLKMEQNSLIG